MAFYTRQEFAKLCGIKDYAIINVNIARGKVVLSGNLIDTNVEENQAFLLKYREKKGITGDTIPLQEPKPKKEPKPVKEEKPKTRTVLPGPPITDEHLPQQSKHNLSKNELDIKIKRADLEKKLEEIEILKVKKMKLHGELIPTDLVKSLVREIAEGVKLAYIDAIENYTVVIANQKKLTEAEKSKIKDHFTPIINQAVEKQYYIAQKGLKAIVAEYSEKKDVGEREL